MDDPFSVLPDAIYNLNMKLCRTLVVCGSPFWSGDPVGTVPFSLGLSSAVTDDLYCCNYSFTLC